MTKIRVEESFAYYKMRNEGKSIENTVAGEIWPNSTEPTRKRNLSNLKKKKSLTGYEVNIICTFTGVSSDFLFSLIDEPTHPLVTW